MYTFKYLVERLNTQLLDSKPVDVGSWHSTPTEGNPMLVTMELPWVDFQLKVPPGIPELQEYVKPNLPWAEEHFQERVSGQPLNPPPSHERWPWNHAQHQDPDEKFSHTYPERFWPKQAGFAPMDENCFTLPDGDCVGRQCMHDPGNRGIRYKYGDLNDVIDLLVKQRYTRQAVLPVWFPEDTGNVNGVRIPCSLTYHFMVRPGSMNDELSCHYTMRSCDFVRHFRDDVYMAARLMQYISGKIAVRPGTLKVSIGSLHAMEGDRAKMEGKV